jgi:hypothetical protein
MGVFWYLYNLKRTLSVIFKESKFELGEPFLKFGMKNPVAQRRQTKYRIFLTDWLLDKDSFLGGTAFI